MHSFLISATDLRRRLDQENLVILDTRFDLMSPGAGRAAYDRGHLPGAHYAHLDRDLSGPLTGNSGRHPLPERDQFAATCSRWGVQMDSLVVCYDDGSGAIAARAWWLLRWMGVANVCLLDGGFAGWMAHGGPLTQGAPATGHGRFSPGVALVRAIDVKEVEKGLADGSLLLVDVRDGARFCGEQEPIDTVAGHVRGAVNHPFAENLDDDGLWLPPAALAERWKSTLGPKAPGQVALMCGSGVTACHGLLALETAGMPGARLYAGSWSEWLRDPSRPMFSRRD